MKMPLAVIPGIFAVVGLALSVMYDSRLFAWLGGLCLVLAVIIFVTGDIE